MTKLFEEAVFKMKVGTMSDIVETEAGVHLIWKNDYVQPKPYFSSSEDDESDEY